MEVEIPTFLFILLGIIEYGLLIYVGLGLLGIKVTGSDNLKVAGLNITIIYLLRKFFLELFSYHILLNWIVLAVTICLIIKVELKMTIIASLLAYILLALGEHFVYGLLEFNPIQVMQDSGLFITVNLLNKIHLILLAFFIYKFNWKLIGNEVIEN